MGCLDTSDSSAPRLNRLMCFVSGPRIEAATRDREQGGDLGCVPQSHPYHVLGRSAFSYPHTGIQGESLPPPRSQPDESP